MASAGARAYNTGLGAGPPAGRVLGGVRAGESAKAVEICVFKTFISNASVIVDGDQRRRMSIMAREGPFCVVCLG